MKLIPLSATARAKKNNGKYFAQVDDEDYDWLIQYTWHVVKQKYTYYAKGYDNLGKRIAMHRLILGINDPKTLGDHEDRNGLNNQRVNLRVSTRSQNNANTKQRSHSPYTYKGVHLKKIKYTLKNGEIKTPGYWAASLSHEGKTINLGLFKTEIDAAKAYDEAAIKYHGEFANLNFKA